MIQILYISSIDSSENIEAVVIFSITLTCLSLLYSISVTAVILLEIIFKSRNVRKTRNGLQIMKVGYQMTLQCDKFTKIQLFCHKKIEKLLYNILRSCKDSYLWNNRNDIQLLIQVFYIHDQITLHKEMNVYFETVLTCSSIATQLQSNNNSATVLSDTIITFGDQTLPINRTLIAVNLYIIVQYTYDI